MSFDFFYQVLAEGRSYDYTAWHREFIQRELERFRRSYPERKFSMPSDGPVGFWNCPSTTVSHIAAPSGADLTRLESSFDIKLPTDFKEFYSLHHEALVLGRNPVLIMNLEQIIEVSHELREAHEVPQKLPRHILRFGWLGTDTYFLLRYCVKEDDWEVMISSYSHATDAELQDKSAWGTPCDKTFTDWLRRMLTTDGAPLHPDHLDDEDDFYVKRIA